MGRKLPKVPCVFLTHATTMVSVCPACGLTFCDDTSVLKHMNHRFSSCHIWFERDSPPPTDKPPPPDVNTIFSSDHFPGAGHIFGSGPGFLGQFQGDTNAGARSTNIYYPFLSKGEWEVAAFLSCSGLSMKLIDKFLSLSLVRFRVMSNFRVLMVTTHVRSSGWDFPFIVHGHCVGKSNSSQVDQHGNPRSSQCLGTSPRTPSCYTIATQSHLSISSSRIRSSRNTFSLLPAETLTPPEIVCTATGLRVMAHGTCRYVISLCIIIDHYSFRAFLGSTPAQCHPSRGHPVTVVGRGLLLGGS